MSNTLKRVQKAIEEQLGLDDGDASPEKTLETDLGADSLDRIEIMMAIEDEFALEISDEDAEQCTTVQDVANLVDRLVPMQAAQA